LPDRERGVTAVDPATLAGSTIDTGPSLPSVLDANALTWYAIDTGSHTPAGIALIPAANRLYVSHHLSGDVRAIDIASTSDPPPNVSTRQVYATPTSVCR
jgi:DNA-binding beta-propeller fold protein YncE